MPYVVTTKRPTPPDETSQPYCAACSHYHEGACLCPDCGRPTPCREHFEGASVQTPSFDVSRCAVATLEERQVLDGGEWRNVLILRTWRPDLRPSEEVADVLFLHDGRVSGGHVTRMMRSLYLLTVPESGGTVGPLPDGTVIEVGASSWVHLALEARRDKSLRPLPVVEAGQGDLKAAAAIIAAFNAREAAT
jgi:hypothetical protein